MSLRRVAEAAKAVSGTKIAPARPAARTGPDASLDEQLTKALNSGQLQKFTKAVRKPLGLPPS